MNTTLSQSISAQTSVESLQLAGHLLEKALSSDDNFPSLLESIKLSPQCLQSASGLSDLDYPSLDSLVPGLPLTQLQTVSRVPLPPEISEHVRQTQHQHCLRGLFPEVHRAYITIDSDLYVWTFEGANDVAYYDGLAETITGVALVKPRAGVFQSMVRHLLVLNTTAEVVILGVTFSVHSSIPSEQMHLLPEPVFQISSDGVNVMTTIGTSKGRIFQGGDDGSLYEIVYQGSGGWFGKRCKRVNLSQGVLSSIIPAFLSTLGTERDAITQLTVDNSRRVLYALTQNGSVRAYDLGSTPGSVTLLSTMSQTQSVQQAFNVVKTLDGSHFRPIVSLSAIEEHDSLHIHLVAVTTSGVRLYFSALSSYTLSQCSNQNSMQQVMQPQVQHMQMSLRPQGLLLVHVRLPPGYTAHAHSAQPRNVHRAHFRKGTLLLVSENGDTLSCLSRDLLPASRYLAETETTLQTEGRVWALEELEPHLSPFSKTTASATPLLVCQHGETAVKYVALTALGAQVMSKLRPVDVLRQALLGPGGADSGAVQGFFQALGEDQACATALVLACLEQTPNPGLAQLATRALLLHGSKETSTQTINSPINQVSPTLQQMSSPTPYFNPSQVSTPIGAGGNQNQPFNQSFGGVVRFSARHDGFFLYFSRILRPIWTLRTAQLMVTDNKKQYICSTVSTEQVTIICSHLEALQSFITQNGSLLLSARIDLSEERKSIEALRGLLRHVLEVLGLWRVLCQHQFHVLAQDLSRELQNKLCSSTFRELILTGQDLCGALVNSLIGSYLGDNASVDAVSSKLREVCPSLYRSEDAACSKANEILLKARNESDISERQQQLEAALKLLLEAASGVNLSAACQQFAACQFYDGVLKLCLTCAQASDLHEYAIQHFKNGEPSNDVQGSNAWERRMECYRELISCLDTLFSQPEAKNSTNYRHLLNSALTQDQDPTLRVAVYEWLVRRGQMGYFLQTSDEGLTTLLGESLEKFLDRTMAANPNDRETSDLLWKLYEKTGRHTKAAEVLHHMAVSKSDTLLLPQRVAYLSRAVLCMRGETAGYAPALGAFNRELEDILDVARLQERVLEEATRVGKHLHPHAKTRLSSTLLTVTELYEEYAVPLDLWESQLGILYCSSTTDPAMVEEVWVNLIKTERANAGPTNRLAALLSKIFEVGQRCTTSSDSFFPLQLLLRELELEACREGAPVDKVHSALLTCDITPCRLLEKYDRLMRQHDWCWGSAGEDNHLFHATASYLQSLLTNRNFNMPSASLVRRETLALAQDVITNCLSQLYTKTNVNDIISTFRNLQTQYSRLS